MKEQINPGKILADKRWGNTTLEQRKKATEKARLARWPKNAIKDAIELSTSKPKK